MESKSKNTPLWMTILPLSMGLGYFGWSYYVKKKDFTSSATISGILFLVGAIPLFSFQGERKNVIASLKTVEPPKPLTRQEMLDFVTAESKLANKEKSYSAFQTLTNDELKVIYSVYRFAKDKAALQAKWGTETSDALARKVAFEEYGIDIPANINIKETAKLAMTKFNNFL